MSWNYKFTCLMAPLLCKSCKDGYTVFMKPYIFYRGATNRRDLNSCLLLLFMYSSVCYHTSPQCTMPTKSGFEYDIEDFSSLSFPWIWSWRSRKTIWKAPTEDFLDFSESDERAYLETHYCALDKETKVSGDKSTVSYPWRGIKSVRNGQRITACGTRMEGNRSGTKA